MNMLFSANPKSNRGSGTLILFIVFFRDAGDLETFMLKKQVS